MAEVASRVVEEASGQRILDLDQPIIDYIVNVLADEDFYFGGDGDGDGVFDALGDLLFPISTTAAGFVLLYSVNTMLMGLIYPQTLFSI